mgnify:CR=1 FL=1
MYSVLLVDDEIHAVRGLHAGVSWHDLQIEHVHSAHSLKQAQQVLMEHPVDIMVCDIEMPQGSGLDLLSWVRKEYPHIETIFLTCHSDFDYARQALRLNSFEYMLKPVDYQEMESVLQRAIAKLQRQREMKRFEEDYRHYQQLWESHKTLVEEKFWMDLLRRAISSSPQSVLEQLKSANLPYDLHTPFIPVYIVVQRWHKPLSERDERIMEYALRNCAEEELAAHSRQVSFVSLYDRTLLILIRSGDSITDMDVKRWCDEYIACCMQYFYCDLCCYIGKPTTLTEMPDMIDRLKELDRNNVTFSNATLFMESHQHKPALIRHAPFELWAMWLEQGAVSRVKQDVAVYMTDLRNEGGVLSSKSMYLLYQDFLQMIFAILQRKGLQANQVFADTLLAVSSEYELRTLSDLEERMLYIIEVVHNSIHIREENMTIVEKVKRYIAESIHDQHLSREDIANHVFLNPDYLTRVFKKETGMSISDYLQQTRIEYAKELLLNTDQSVSEVANASGYSNLSYFSSIFKKFTGSSPGEYRKLRRG